MSAATLSGYTVRALSVQIPAWGIWWADLELVEDVELSGSVVLVVAGLGLVGTVLTGGSWQGRARYRIAGGAGGWGRAVAARSYSNDAGVKLSKVIGDAAASCGESFDASTASGTVGSHWVREAGPASRALALLAGHAWYVGEDGVTRLGARPAVRYTGEATRIRSDPAGSWIELGADSLVGLVPGVVVDGLAAVDVVHTIRGGVLRSVLWGAEQGTSSRFVGAFARLVETITARTRYRGLFSYRVVAQSGERVDLQAERCSSGMPDLLRVRVRLAPGFKVEHLPGSLVLVAFVDGDPGRPVVVAGDDPDSPGWLPDEVSLDAKTVAGGAPGYVTPTIKLGDGTGAVARIGDTVTVGGETGVLTLVSGIGGVGSRVSA